MSGVAGPGAAGPGAAPAPGAGPGAAVRRRTDSDASDPQRPRAPRRRHGSRDPESDYDSAGSDSELSDQENGEPQPVKIDHDEDRRNPQYIPKRGTFYEHDDRTADNGEDTTGSGGENAAPSETRGEGGGGGGDTPSERRARGPRKSEICDKWSHDKYNENEQTPKSREELVSIYGYDIRNEDAPPHARRNRRYGRGPNKYTRTWEDEEAYRRATLTAAHRKPQASPTPEDFPELGNNTPRRQSKKLNEKPAPARPPRSSNSSEATENGNGNSPRVAERRNGPTSNNNRTNRTPPAAEKVPIVDITITANAATNNGPTQRKLNVGSHAQQRPVATPANSTPPPPLSGPKPDERRTLPAASERHASVQPQKQPPQQQSGPPLSKVQPQPHNQAQQTPAPQQPALGENRPGSKRYSSLRQRPLTEPYTPPTPPQQVAQQLPPQPQQQQQQQPQQPQQQPQQPQQQQVVQQQQLQQHRYVPEFQPSSQPPHQGSPGPPMLPNQQLLHQVDLHQVHRNTQVSQAPHGPSPPHQPLPQQQHPQQVRLGMMEQQQLMQPPHTHQLHNISTPHIANNQMQPTQAYAPPAMMPAQYMQGANNPVYAAAPVYAPPPPAPYPHQLYQHHNYTHQPAAGGVTYYSPVDQEPPAPAPRAQRRPTAAIPIVPPPLNSNRSSSSSSEKDNIDRIVDNMFVRKQRPAAHAPSSTGDKTDPKAEPRSSQDSSLSSSLNSSTISTDSRPSAERQNSKDSTIELPEAKPEETKPTEPLSNASETQTIPAEIVKSISDDPTLAETAKDVQPVHQVTEVERLPVEVSTELTDVKEVEKAVQEMNLAEEKPESKEDIENISIMH